MFMDSRRVRRDNGDEVAWYGHRVAVGLDDGVGVGDVPDVGEAALRDAVAAGDNQSP